MDQFAYPRFRVSQMEHQFRKERKTSGLTSGEDEALSVDASFRFDVESVVGGAAFSESVDGDDVVDADVEDDAEPKNQT